MPPRMGGGRGGGWFTEEKGERGGGRREERARRGRGGRKEREGNREGKKEGQGDGDGGRGSRGGGWQSERDRGRGFSGGREGPHRKTMGDRETGRKMEIPSTERKRGGRGISQAMKGGEGGGWSIETKRQGGGEREKGRGREKGKVGEWVRRGGGEVIHSEGRKEDRRWVVGKRMGWGGGEATVHTEGDGRHKNIIPKCVSQNGHPPKCQLSVRWCRVDVGAIREWHLQKCRPPKCQPNRVIRQKKKKKKSAKSKSLAKSVTRAKESA